MDSPVKGKPMAGLSCGLPQSFLAMVHMLLNHKTGDFAGTSRKNICLGGDTCSRSIGLGSILGALEGVPDQWASRRAPTEEGKMM